MGETLSFLYDDSLTVQVSDTRNKVSYQGEQYSVSALASQLLHERCGWAENANVNGWRYFTKDGITLSDLRRSMEGDEMNE